MRSGTQKYVAIVFRLPDGTFIREGREQGRVTGLSCTSDLTWATIFRPGSKRNRIEHILKEFPGAVSVLVQVERVLTTIEEPRQ